MKSFVRSEFERGSTLATGCLFVRIGKQKEIASTVLAKRRQMVGTAIVQPVVGSFCKTRYGARNRGINAAATYCQMPAEFPERLGEFRMATAEPLIVASVLYDQYAIKKKFRLHLHYSGYRVNIMHGDRTSHYLSPGKPYPMIDFWTRTRTQTWSNTARIQKRMQLSIKHW